MDLKYDCIPCVTRQLIELATRVTDNEIKQKDIITYGLDIISKHTFTSSAPYLTGKIYDYGKKVSGVADAFKEEKETFNVIAEKLVKQLGLKKMVASSEQPLETAVRLSIAGNIIDFSLGIAIEESGVRASIHDSLHSPFYGSTVNDLSRAIEKAEKILILADNAGEIVFDKLLIEQLPREKVTYVVKGGPCVNDATMADVKAVGMDKLVRVIDTGAAYQGIVFDESSEAFIEAFDNADLVISKGQANFECIGQVKDKPVFFLLRAKCQCIADEIGCKKGAFVLLEK